MIPVLLALAPVFLVILAGWGARLSGLVPESAWGGINRLAYFVLAPVYMFAEVSRANLSFDGLAFVTAACGGFLVMGVIGFALLPLTKGDRPAFASVHQGALRWNAFVILAAASALMGPEASGLVALMMGPTIPIVNVITVSVHARYGHGQNPSLKGVLRSIITNPLILACVAGLVFNLSGLTYSGAVQDIITIVGRGALGVTLMCVGAGLNLAAISARPGLVTASVGLKLIAAPLAFVGLGYALGLSGIPLACLALIGASPSPPAAYILSREMGGDPRLMAGQVTAATLFSALAMPAALAFAYWLG